MFKLNFPGRWPILSKVDFSHRSQLTADNGNALANAGRLNLMDLGSGAREQKDSLPEQDSSGTYLAFPAVVTS